MTYNARVMAQATSEVLARKARRCSEMTFQMMFRS